jgi:hypothetical protein
MIGAVFGHLKDGLTTNQKDVFMKNPDYDSNEGSYDDNEHTGSFTKKKVRMIKIDRNMPIGILQFVNKLDNEPITEYDRLKFESLADLIGLAIDNCSEHHNMFNVRVGILDNVKKVNEWVEKHKQEGDNITS